MEHELVQLLAQHVGDVLAVFTTDGMYLYASPAVRDVLGYEPEELIGAWVLGFMHPDDLPAISMQSAIETGALTLYRVRHRHRDGHHVWLEVKARAVRDAAGGPPVIVAVLRAVPEGEPLGERLLDTEAARAEQGALLALTTDAILCRSLATDTIRYWNPAAEGLYGWTAEEARGHPARQLLRTAFPVPVTDIEAELRATGAWRGELVHTARDGRRVLVASRWSLPTDPAEPSHAVLQTDTDITGQRASEAHLRTTQEQFRLMFERAPVGMALVALDGRWLRVNAALCRMVGRGPDELMGMSVFDVMHPDDVAVSAHNAQRVRSGRVDDDQVERRYVHADGHTIWVQVNVAVVLEGPGEPHMVAHIVDITDRRQAEDEAAALARARAVTVEAQEADLKARERLLATLRRSAEREEGFRTLVVHELATPIAAVRAFAHVLDRHLGDGGGDADDDDLRAVAGVQTALKGLRGEAARLQELVERMEELRTLELDEFVCDLRPAKLLPLLEDAAVYVRGLPGAHPAEVTCEDGACAMVDPVRLAEALRSVVNNAARYSPAGTPVLLRCGPGGDGRLRISIDDLGRGIAPGERERVLDKYERGTGSTDIAGSGLGLYIARRIAEGHGGRLFMTDRAGAPGTRVVMELTRAP